MRMRGRRRSDEGVPASSLNQLDVSLMPVTCLMKNAPHITCRQTADTETKQKRTRRGHGLFTEEATCTYKPFATKRACLSVFSKESSFSLSVSPSVCLVRFVSHRGAQDEMEEHGEGAAGGG